MKSWRYEFENLTPDELLAIEAHKAEYGEPMSWYDYIPPEHGFVKFPVGTRVRVVKPYLDFDEPVVGRVGVVTQWLGMGINGENVEVAFGDDDIPPRLRYLSFTEDCLEPV